jgi:hypothetical protein
MAKYVQSMYYGKEFFVMNFIVTFCWLQGLGVVSNWMPMVQGIRLFQNSTCSKVTSVCYEVKWYVVVQ